jgi:hypothetical protein
LRHAEDYDLWLRMAADFRLANLDDVLLRYRRHPAQVSIQHFRQQCVSTLAASASASLRARGDVDPLDSAVALTEPVLRALGLSTETLDRALARAYLTSCRSMTDANELPLAERRLVDMLGAQEWRNADAPLVADYLLLSARLQWRQRKFLGGAVAALGALRVRPVILGRPFKPLLRRVRRRGMRGKPLSPA